MTSQATVTPQINARVNLLLKPVNVSESQAAFSSLFIALKDKYNNRFYCLKKEYEEVVRQESATWFSTFFNNQSGLDAVGSAFSGYEFISGELTNLPIPSASEIKMTSVYQPYGLDTSKNRHIITWLTHLKREINNNFEAIVPVCTTSQELSGTACTGIGSSEESQLYMRIKKTDDGKMIPLPKNNDVYEGIVIKHNQKSELFMTPLFTPSQATIYIIADTEQKLMAYIKKYHDASKPYSIPLNGFIIPIDDWDCSIHFIPEATN